MKNDIKLNASDEKRKQNQREEQQQQQKIGNAVRYATFIIVNSYS